MFLNHVFWSFFFWSFFCNWFNCLIHEIWSHILQTSSCYTLIPFSLNIIMDYIFGLAVHCLMHCFYSICLLLFLYQKELYIFLSLMPVYQIYFNLDCNLMLNHFLCLNISMLGLESACVHFLTNFKYIYCCFLQFSQHSLFDT